MAKKIRCPRPINRLIMMRTKGLSGPHFQNTGVSCVKSAGNYYAPGMPGSGPRPISGYVANANEVIVNFSSCVVVSGVARIFIEVNGVSKVAASSGKVTDTQWKFASTDTIEAGDEVLWRYVGGLDSIVDCDEGEDIANDLEEMSIPIYNGLVLDGNFVLLETGGKDIILLQDDTDDTSGIETEDAA